ncbi:MAG: transporter substrate-binding domain-containing protein [Gammaproteobacteria bacterium]|nr:transporter substrate-binding domain-containing protein [Gammaproteobacteria bacterium]
MNLLKLSLGLLIVLSPQLLFAEQYKVGFAYAKPPFVYAAKLENSSETRGIELEIIRAALAEENISFSPRYFWRDQLTEKLIERQVDAVSGVRPVNANLFYSNSTVYFQNFAITPIAAKPIHNIADLAARRVVAWGGAAADLGDVFQAVVPKMARFSEVLNQQNQVASFLSGTFDIIVIDEHIFKYYAFAQGANPADFAYYPIFGERTEFVTGFRDESLRNRFNSGLRKIKESGSYDKIFHDHFD